jgi:hypothetical protein
LIASAGLLLALSAWQSVAAQFPLLLHLIGAGVIALIVYGGLLFVAGRRPLLEAWLVGLSLVRRRKAEVT